MAANAVRPIKPASSAGVIPPRQKAARAAQALRNSDTPTISQSSSERVNWYLSLWPVSISGTCGSGSGGNNLPSPPGVSFAWANGYSSFGVSDSLGAGGGSAMYIL